MSKQSALNISHISPSIGANESRIDGSPMKLDDGYNLLPGEVIYPPPAID